MQSNNKSIDWIEEAISKKHIISYEYESFSNFQEIGSGTIYRANWEHSKHYLALKPFLNLNNAAIKEIANEVITKKIVRDLFY
jgi:hypothetical protein